MPRHPTLTIPPDAAGITRDSVVLDGLAHARLAWLKSYYASRLGLKTPSASSLIRRAIEALVTELDRNIAHDRAAGQSTAGDLSNTDLEETRRFIAASRTHPAPLVHLSSTLPALDSDLGVPLMFGEAVEAAKGVQAGGQ